MIYTWLWLVGYDMVSLSLARFIIIVIYIKVDFFSHLRIVVNA